MKPAAGRSIFEPALRELERSGRAWSEPISFQEYCTRNGFPGTRTAAHISVQSLEGLDRPLAEAGVMVFRKGPGRCARSCRGFRYAKASGLLAWHAG